MVRALYLSYSGWKKWTGCWFSYWNSYINNTPVDGPDDRLGALFGSVVGVLFEDFYKLKIWKHDQPQGSLVDRIDATVAKVMKQETTSTRWRKAGVFMWKGEGEGQNPKGMYADIDELKADVRDAVARGFRIIRHNRLLGPKVKTETDLSCTIDGRKLGGRSDFIIQRTRPHNDLGIWDGKGTRWLQYVDERQLRWYEMLFRRKFQQAPDVLGWIFWRYDPPEGTRTIEPDEGACDELLARVMKDFDIIERLSAQVATPTKDFEAARKVFLPVLDREDEEKPEDAEQECRFCLFGVNAICPTGAALRKSNKWD